MPQITAKVRISVTVPVGTWSGKCSLDELREQVRKEGAMRVLEAATQLGWTVSSEPEVVIIVASEDKS